MTKRSALIFVIVSMLLPALTLPSTSSACNPRTPYQKSPGLSEITELKELYLSTNLAEAVIVTPKRYKKSAKRLKKIIKKISHGKIKVRKDTHVSGDILNTHNVIAIGNMETNAFIRKLYREWYVLLDLKYPGGNGYVVRTLHNPYSTGRNVILLGGSSDKGVAKAIAKFKKFLKASYYSDDGTYNLPRLMKIKLGKGYQLPKIGTDIGLDVSNWNVPAWRDFYRFNQTPHNFGWNPVSIAGILYYMTGKKAYLNLFKTLAMPSDSESPPAAMADHPAFYDPSNPLTDVYHYHTHLLDLVYDLIEESPDFDNEERLFITNRLLEHQDFLDPEHDNIALNPDRHCSYDMLNIYTGSRYFAKYYPDTSWNSSGNDGTGVWEKRLDNVRESFYSLISDPTWGESDTLAWVPTYTEVVFDFFMLDGFDRFVKDPDTGYETAKTMMSFFDIIRTGKEADGDNTLNYVTANLLNKAAFMLEDDRYIWLLKDLGFDENQFRIGPSFWHPNADIAHPPEPPQDVANQIRHFPLVYTNWFETNNYLHADKQIPEENGFQVLSFRNGLTKYDDFLQMDGFYGKGRNPYHLNSIYWLRMFGDAETGKEGIPILWGYENDVDVFYNGMASLHQAKCAALNNWHFDKEQNMLYLETEVPNMPESKWKRHVLYMQDEAAIIIDQIIADTKGNFGITCSWSLFTSVFDTTALPDITTSRGILLSHADDSAIELGDIKKSGTELREKLKQKAVAELEAGASTTIGNAFSRTAINSFTIRRVKDFENAYLLFKDGTPHSLAVLGNFLKSGFEIKADFAYYNEEIILQVINGKAEVKEQPDSSGFLMMLNTLDFHEYDNNQEDEIEINWLPSWQQQLDGEPAILDISNSGWVAVNKGGSSQIIQFDPLTGQTLSEANYNSPILSLWSAKTEAQSAAFAILAGYKDNALIAYEIDEFNVAGAIWNKPTKIHQDVLDLNAPWFTSDIPGVYSILVDDFWKSGEKIAVGLASTVEFWELDGTLIDRVMTQWGSVTHIGLLTDVAVKPYDRMLIAGKRYTGYPFFSGIINNGGVYQNVSNTLFYDVASGDDFTVMHAWNQNGVCQMLIDDIDNDQIKEFIYTLGGHWNELRVYKENSPTAAPEWLRYFGPGNQREDFMKGLAVIQLDPETKAIATATRDGRVNLFSTSGEILWAENFNRDITRMEAVKSDSTTPGIVVGFENDIITLLDKNGEIRLNAKLESAPMLMASDQSDLYCLEQGGTLSAFSLGY